MQLHLSVLTRIHFFLIVSLASYFYVVLIHLKSYLFFSILKMHEGEKIMTNDDSGEPKIMYGYLIMTDAVDHSCAFDAQEVKMSILGQDRLVWDINL